MNMTQVSIITAILLLLLSLHAAPAWSSKMHRCYDKEDLNEAAEKKLSSHYRQSPNLPSAGAVASDSFSCPLDLYQRQQDLNISMRSVSPWTIVRRTMEGHYPSSYGEAKCLCTGCILMEGGRPVENHNYVSVPLMHSRLFLKREPCSGGQRYHLIPVTLDVAVGCVCLKSRSKEI